MCDVIHHTLCMQDKNSKVCAFLTQYIILCACQTKIQNTVYLRPCQLLLCIPVEIRPSLYLPHEKPRSCLLSPSIHEKIRPSLRIRNNPLALPDFIYCITRLHFCFSSCCFFSSWFFSFFFLSFSGQHREVRILHEM